MVELQKPVKLRLFLALSLPDLVKAELERAQSTLKRAVGEGSVRWTVREQWHLTLRFLGYVEAASVSALSAAAIQACVPFQPLEMRAQEIGFFPARGLPRVIWAGAQDAAGQLAALQQALQAATLPFTSEPPEARFSGHVTLGRGKSIRRTEAAALQEAANKWRGKPFGVWTAGEVELFRSQLSPHGPAYTSLARFPFP